MEDRLMTIKELAAYLNVNERTVLKLVTEGVLPGVKVGAQWRFRRAMIDAWLDDQMLGVTPAHIETLRRQTSSLEVLELASCFHPDHIISDLAATTKKGIIEELAELAGRLGLVRDSTWFVGALMERENVMPSALGGGVAFLHTLRRNIEQVTRPFMVLGRSRPGVDFSALDGKPTHLLFVLGLKFDELCLPWLQKISRMFAREEAVEAIREKGDAAAIYAALAEADRTLY
jgi:excisionase family DNA binding protein